MREVRPAAASYSDRIMRPTRHVSDTKNCFSATSMAALSYRTCGTYTATCHGASKMAHSCYITNVTASRYEKTVFRTGPVSHRWPHRCGEAITSGIRYAPGTHAPNAPSTGGASSAPALRSASVGCWPAPRVRTRPAPQPRGPASRRPRRPRPASRSRG